MDVKVCDCVSLGNFPILPMISNVPMLLCMVCKRKWVEPVAIYADGGVIKKNPSPYGGTWAWCGVDELGNRVIESSGVFEPVKNPVTNNWSEQVAITRALEFMPAGWSGTVYSDSMIALGRVFDGWRLKNLPSAIARRSAIALARLGTVKPSLLQGHPTRKDLETGVGKKRGYPVSVHNVWADKECGRVGREFMEKCLARQTEEA